MSEIIDIKLGQSLPPERWLEAAEHLEEVFRFVADYLLKLNGDGLGKQDAEEFTSDANLALLALRFVAANPEGLRFIALPGGEGGDT